MKVRFNLVLFSSLMIPITGLGLGLEAAISLTLSYLLGMTLEEDSLLVNKLGVLAHDTQAFS